MRIPAGYRQLYDFEGLRDGLYALTDSGRLWGPLPAPVAAEVRREKLVCKLVVDRVETPRTPLLSTGGNVVWLESPPSASVNWGNW